MSASAAGHTLILVRHGKSDWGGQHSDRDRPLGRRGRRQAPESGHWLAEQVAAGALPPVDLAVVSPAVRARDTWALVAGELAREPEVLVEERVYSWQADDLLAVVRDLPEGAVTAALVGHNPALEDVVELLTGRWVPMPTSALAVVELVCRWAAAGPECARLRASGRPPEEPIAP